MEVNWTEKKPYSENKNPLKARMLAHHLLLQIKFCWLFIYIACKMTVLSSCNREHVGPEPKIFTTWLFIENGCQPGLNAFLVPISFGVIYSALLYVSD